MLDLVVEDMRENRLDVLVVWKSSRIERRGAWNAFDLARKVRDAGGRIEYVQDAYLNDTNSMSDVMLALAATKDKAYSEDLSKAIKASQVTIRSNNGVLTCLPWGYLVACRSTARLRSPPTNAGRIGRRCWRAASPATPAGRSRRGWMPKGSSRSGAASGMRMSSAGISATRSTAAGGSAGRTRRCSPPRRWCRWTRGPRPGDALTHRPKRGPRTSRANPVKPLLASLRCARCGSPMYRIHAGSRDGGKYFYYRCAGSGPQRKGCGNAVPLAPAETFVACDVHLQ